MDSNAPSSVEVIHEGDDEWMGEKVRRGKESKEEKLLYPWRRKNTPIVFRHQARPAPFLAQLSF